MRNTIADRVADFLKSFPPFDLLNKEQLVEISREVKIRYFEKSRVIYAQKDELRHEFFIINKGAVTLKKEVEGVEHKIDKYDEGDVFGLRPLFAKENYKITAITDEESILYAIPIEIFKPFVGKNKQIAQFLTDSFTSNTETPYSKKFQKNVLLKNNEKSIKAGKLFELKPVQYVKKVISAKPETKVSEIAKLMSHHDIGSVIIAENRIPKGIITDKDLRNKLATGSISNGDNAGTIMSSPVLCYPKNISIAQAQITMMKHKVSHLCITKDGTPNTKILGILAHHDILLMKGTNPAVIMKAIIRSNSTKELKRLRGNITTLLDGYISQKIPLSFTSKILFEFNDATIKRVIERCIEKMGAEVPANFAWMSLGSQGRKEQLLNTDQDNAIVFEDVDDEKKEEVRTYFLNLARRVNKRLLKIGFEYCPAEMMAKNPKWCLSLSEWKKQFDRWTSETGSDEILLCSIFFDFDISYGDSNLTNELSEHVFQITKNNDLFNSKLAASALRSPSPFGFFRQFLVEKDGAYKDFFDLKKRGLMPITDAGRILAIHYQLKNINNTADRFEKLATLVPANKDLFLSCSYASKAMLKFKTKHGLINKDDGRFIELEALTKEEKMKLTRCFKTLSSVQELLKIKFNTDYFV